MSKAAQAVARAVAEMHEARERRIKQQRKSPAEARVTEQDDSVEVNDVSEIVGADMPKSEPEQTSEGDGMPRTKTAAAAKRIRSATPRKRTKKHTNGSGRANGSVSGAITGAELMGTALKQRVRVSFTEGSMTLMPSTNREAHAKTLTQAINALVK